MHDRQLSGVIELEAGYPSTAGEDGRLGQFPELPPVNEGLQNILLDIVVRERPDLTSLSIRFSRAPLREAVSGFRNPVISQHAFIYQGNEKEVSGRRESGIFFG